MIKTLSKVGVERISHSIIKAIYERSIANILSNEKLRESFFLQDQEQDKDACFYHVYLT